MPNAGCPVPARSGRICRIIRPDIRQNEKSGRMIWPDIRQIEKSGRIIRHCRISGPTLVYILYIYTISLHIYPILYIYIYIFIYMPSISRTENLQVCKKLNFGCFENMKKCLASVFWAIKKTLKQDGCKATLHFSYYNIWWRQFLLDTCFSPTNKKSLWKKMNPWNISKTLCKTLLFLWLTNILQIYI